MKRLGVVAAGLVAAFAVLACKDSPPTVTVFIECDRTDTFTPPGEQDYEPGISISYSLSHLESVGEDQNFAVASRGIPEKGHAYTQQLFYNTCKAFLGGSAKEATPSPSNTTYVIIECSGKPYTEFINAHFEKASLQGDRSLDAWLNYEEFEEYKWVSLGEALKMDLNDATRKTIELALREK